MNTDRRVPNPEAYQVSTFPPESRVLFGPNRLIKQVLGWNREIKNEKKKGIFPYVGTCVHAPFKQLVPRGQVTILVTTPGSWPGVLQSYSYSLLLSRQ